MCIREGSHLASIHSESENGFFRGIFVILRTNHSHFSDLAPIEEGGNRPIWIGFNHFNDNGPWHWSDSTFANYTNWSPGEPNGEQCAVMDSGPNGDQWRDIYCHTAFSDVICKHSLISASTTPHTTKTITTGNK